MKNITSLIKELRKRTGAKIVDCKQALIKSNRNIEEAIIFMRKSGYIKSEKKSIKSTKEGCIFLKIDDTYRNGIVLEINCETDFVAKNSDFLTFGNKVLNTAFIKKIYDIEILKKTFKDECSFLTNKIDENIQIRRISFLQNNLINCYLHRNRIGVLIAGNNIEKKLLKKIAMHIAANKPEYIKSEDIPETLIKNEHDIQLDLAMRTAKTTDIAKKIVAGRIKKFIDSISLLNQPFIMDSSKTISQILQSKQSEVTKFIRFELGEKIKTF
ncbi:translation elongation factor Ts [Candidatus Tachikawaea gelatinosa]|uniref:Elongation factor Ts n=1 Tax=Candidatus Tachikawaea gelatinosa TaxID=1410383 RepID=A0A090ALA0_9ENTR|nr:translation elongation factor Ts [Candidatus Tachikawaea gelatinosa]BAP58394.1 elongation factor Ts [Candidatus Tachikawaea gelatinosa]